MDQTILTPRLKLTLLGKVERGSPEFEWCQELWTNEKSTWWSIAGKSRSDQDIEAALKRVLPNEESEEKQYRVAYAVHEILESTIDPVTDDRSTTTTEQKEPPTRFIGIVNLKSLDKGHLVLTDEFTLSPAISATTLTAEIAYMFLPAGWGKGYATESIAAMFEACKRATVFWAPFSKLYVRALVNLTNLPSQRVMEKTGMLKKGVYDWAGKAVFVAGEWKERDQIVIYGQYLLE